MFPMHPALVEMAIEARAVELRHPGARASWVPRRRPAGAAGHAGAREMARSGRVRQAMGWFLVRVGLRLVLPRAAVLPAR